MRTTIFITLLFLLAAAGIGIIAIRTGGLREHLSTPDAQHTPLPPGPTPPALLSPDSVCAADLRAFYNVKYDYQICFPATWTADAGSPANPSWLALGPRDRFRPLIIISVFPASSSMRAKDLLLTDTVVQEDHVRQVAGVNAEQITFRSLQGMTQHVVFFTARELGFSILAMEGLEEEHTDNAFEAILASFRVLPHAKQPAGP